MWKKKSTPEIWDSRQKNQKNKEKFPIFLSTVIVVKNSAHSLERIITIIVSELAALVSEYELIIIDNASTDVSISILNKMTKENGLPNLQVYSLTKEIDSDTATWVGMERALGDFVVAFNPDLDNIKFLSKMLEKAVGGYDIVLAKNEHSSQSFFYNLTYSLFNISYKILSGVNLEIETSKYRVLSKQIINFILQHPLPVVAYRHIPATGGFSRINLSYNLLPNTISKKHLKVSINRGLRLLVSTTRGPIRVATTLCLFGAIANLLYSLYVIVIVFIDSNITQGWASLSLQQSSMFFLISLVLLVLGEYIGELANLLSEGPLYHIAREFNSEQMTGRNKLNIEEVDEQSDEKPL